MKYKVGYQFAGNTDPGNTNPAVIVLDNAPYHNIKTDDSYYPRTSDRKGVIQEWLRSRDIEFDNDEIKVQCL